MKDRFIKLRSDKGRVARWKGAAHDRGQTLTGFVVASVEASISGRVDQAALDMCLRSIRADANAAKEAATVEAARACIQAIQDKITALRGNFGR